MKKNINCKSLVLALAAALALTALTACGNAAGTAGAPNDAGSSLAVMQEDDGGAVGTVLLSVNPEIEMDYDREGNVVALTALNDDGRSILESYTGYEGRACTAVIGELVDKINAGGYFDATIDGHEKNIVLKLERGSAYPNDQFLNELADAVRLVVEDDQIGSRTVTLDGDDYDDTYGDRGYISTAAAQNLLSTQLGRDDIRFVEKEYDLEDGEYEVEFVLDGVEYEYEVNAVTGKITEMNADYRDYDDTDYGSGSDGTTDYGYTDYGSGSDGITDYGYTDYGSGADGITNYDDTDYGPNADGITDYGYTDYGTGGVTNYDDDDWYGDPTGSDYRGDSDDGSDYDRDWDDTDYDD